VRSPTTCVDTLYEHTYKFYRVTSFLNIDLVVMYSIWFVNVSSVIFSCICQMVKLLLEKGATMNAFDKKDRRAIHWAAVMGHVEVVRTLVHFGAELSCSDKQVTW